MQYVYLRTFNFENPIFNFHFSSNKDIDALRIMGGFRCAQWGSNSISSKHMLSLMLRKYFLQKLISNLHIYTRIVPIILFFNSHDWNFFYLVGHFNFFLTAYVSSLRLYIIYTSEKFS
jgi:hypothetical protein